MKVFRSGSDPEISRMLSNGAVGALRTDTLYGLVAKADNEAAVSRVYELKHRNAAKSPIVLISSLSQLYDNVPEASKQFLESYWPGAVSVILPSTQAPHWIRRQNNSVAYRLPNLPWLQTLLTQTGPLVAPSANPEGEPPAQNLHQVVSYFDNRLDFIVDAGEVIDQKPSRLARITLTGEVEWLR